MALINENDFNSKELISALKNIEVESVNIAEVHFLRKENQRLRNDLLNRHQVRLSEIQHFEKKKQELAQAQKQIHSESSQVLHLKNSIVKTNQNLDEALDLLFQISYGFLSYDNTPDIFEKLKKLHKLIHDGSKELSGVSFPEGNYHLNLGGGEGSYFVNENFLPFDNGLPVQTFQDPSCQNLDNTKVSHQEVQKDWQSLLEEIQNFDFETAVEN